HARMSPLLQQAIAGEYRLKCTRVTSRLMRQNIRQQRYGFYVAAVPSLIGHDDRLGTALLLLERRSKWLGFDVDGWPSICGREAVASRRLTPRDLNVDRCLVAAELVFREQSMGDRFEFLWIAS